jgi:ribosomal protein S18 acetylase RimI-like enzyme
MKDGTTLLAAAAVAPAALHAAFAAAFADYLLGPFQLAPQQWPLFLARQGVDLAASRVALGDGAVRAFALVAPRPAIGHWRLATMGAVPQSRGSGAAPALLDDFIARAGAAGMEGVELECFEQNERALRLYQGRGFLPRHPLYGYTHRGAAAGPQPDGVTAVDLAGAFGWIEAFAREHRDLHFQVTPASLRALPLQLQAWRRGTAQLVFARSDGGALTVHSLLDAQPQQDDAQALALALLQGHPACEVRVPQLQRPDLGGAALERLGFQRLALNQLLLRRAA